MNRTQRKAQSREIFLKAAKAAYRAVGDTNAPPASLNPPTAQPYAAIRGELDAKAIILRYSDPDMHRVLRPGTHGALFDTLELARCEILALRVMPGIGINMLADIDYKVARATPNTALDDLFLRVTIAAARGTHINGAIRDAWQLWSLKQKGLSLKNIQPLIDNADCQITYAEKAKSLIREMMDNKDKENKPDTQNEKDETPALQGSNVEKNSETPQKQSKKDARPSTKSDHAAAYPASQEETANSRTTINAPHMSNAPSHTAAQHIQPAAGQNAESYRIYTREFDRVAQASDLMMNWQIQLLWKKFQSNLQKEGAGSARLINQLQRRLQSRLPLTYEFDKEEGILDPSRLSCVITDPFNTHIYRQIKETKARDTAVTLLVDNSGSLKGRSILIAMLTAYQLATALERCSIPCEVLGYTTSQWAGGKSHDKWARSGRTLNPGRLNDLLHIIYKPADIPMRHVKHNFAAILNENLLKENIDGESLEWAYKRLLERSESRRILIAISDGAPVDDRTHACNDANYLSRHLKQVIRQIENDKLVELSAIGIGHNTSLYYKNSITIGNMEHITETLVNHMDDLLLSVDCDGRTVRKRKHAVRPFLPVSDRV